MFELLVHVLILALVAGLVYWIVTLVAGLLPPPIGNVVRVVALVLLAIAVIGWLLGEAGLGVRHWHRW